MPLRTKWRPFKDEVVELVPKEPGAYELGYRDTVVYIGSSNNSIQSRLHSHRKAKRFMKVTHFRFKVVEWASDAIELEKKLSKEYKKSHNGKPPRLQVRAPDKETSIWEQW